MMILSETGNEKLVCSWSDGITDKSARDFCDTANAVFMDHFDLDYMRRKYQPNIYGSSLIAIIYKDDVPVAVEGAWRNDVNGRPAFQICDTATLPSMRKRGYNTAIAKALISEIKRVYPDALVYRFSGPMSYRMAEHLGFARTLRYARIYHGETLDFLENMPVIDDAYVDAFLLNKNDLFVKQSYRVGGGYSISAD